MDENQPKNVSSEQVNVWKAVNEEHERLLQEELNRWLTTCGNPITSLGIFVRVPEAVEERARVGYVKVLIEAYNANLRAFLAFLRVNRRDSDQLLGVVVAKFRFLDASMTAEEAVKAFSEHAGLSEL